MAFAADFNAGIVSEPASYFGLTAGHFRTLPKARNWHLEINTDGPAPTKIILEGKVNMAEQHREHVSEWYRRHGVEFEGRELVKVGMQYYFVEHDDAALIEDDLRKFNKAVVRLDERGYWGQYGGRTDPRRFYDLPVMTRDQPMKALRMTPKPCPVCQRPVMPEPCEPWPRSEGPQPWYVGCYSYFPYEHHVGVNGDDEADAISNWNARCRKIAQSK